MQVWNSRRRDEVVEEEKKEETGWVFEEGRAWRLIPLFEMYLSLGADLREDHLIFLYLSILLRDCWRFWELLQHERFSPQSKLFSCDLSLGDSQQRLSSLEMFWGYFLRVCSSEIFWGYYWDGFEGESCGFEERGSFFQVPQRGQLAEEVQSSEKTQQALPETYLQ